MSDAAIMMLSLDMWRDHPTDETLEVFQVGHTILRERKKEAVDGAGAIRSFDIGRTSSNSSTRSPR
jgi:hypothetical protein